MAEVWTVAPEWEAILGQGFGLEEPEALYAGAEPVPGGRGTTRRIRRAGRTFLLKREIACDVSVENRLVVIEFKPLGLRAYAPTREAALQDFAEEFAFAWDYYVGTADSALTNDALKLKRQLLSLVKEVVTGETPQGSQRSPRPGA